MGNEVAIEMSMSYPIEKETLRELMALARRHGVEGLVYNELLKTPENLPAGAITEMRQVSMATMMSYEQKKAIMRKACAALDHSVVLKGFGLAELYEQPYLRSWGDLDIYVGPADYHEAAKRLREAFPEAIHHDEEWEELKHYCFVMPDGNVIEMHRRTMALLGKKEQAYFYPLEEEAMRHPQYIDVEGMPIAIPEARFNMLYVFMHGWEHWYEETGGLKQLLDIALLCRASQHVPGIEAYLKEALTQLKLMEPWQIVGCCLHHVLQLPKEEWWFYKENKRWKYFLGDALKLPKPQPTGKPNRYEKREQAKKMNVVLRKMVTLWERVAKTAPRIKVCPRYALRQLWYQILKGIDRTIHHKAMLDY